MPETSPLHTERSAAVFSGHHSHAALSLAPFMFPRGISQQDTKKIRGCREVDALPQGQITKQYQNRSQKRHTFAFAMVVREPLAEPRFPAASIHLACFSLQDCASFVSGMVWSRTDKHISPPLAALLASHETRCSPGTYCGQDELLY